MKLILILLVGIIAYSRCQNPSSCSSEPTVQFITLADNLDLPVVLTTARISSNASSEWLFVGQRTGHITMLDISGLSASSNSTGLLPQVNFADLSSSVLQPTDVNDTRGLLGLAFSRNFDTNGLYYVYYSALPQGVSPAAEPEACISRGANISGFDCSTPPVSHWNRLEEWKATFTGSGDSITVSNSLSRTLLVLTQPFNDNNGVDSLAYDPNHDWLWLGTGDGGCYKDPFNFAQNEDILLGKVLRINITSGSNVSCDVALNNITALTDNCPDMMNNLEMFAYGLRDPRGFTWDVNANPIVPDDGIIFQEIDILLSSGMNLGWDLLDGFACSDLTNDICPQAIEISVNTTLAPAAVLNNSFTGNNGEEGRTNQDEYASGLEGVIIGGILFKGSNIACLTDAYVFASQRGDSSLWYINPAQYNETFLNPSQCNDHQSSLLSESSALRVFQVAVTGDNTSGEYDVNAQIRSMGTTLAGDMMFTGTASSISGDGIVWWTLPASSSSSS